MLKTHVKNTFYFCPTALSITHNILDYAKEGMNNKADFCSFVAKMLDLETEEVEKFVEERK